jgi:outer membrane protein assembly factor BamA
MYKKYLLLFSLLISAFQWCSSQDTTLVAADALSKMDTTLIADDTLSKPDTASVAADSLSKFDSMNAKMERLFKIIPVPIYSYSTEAGHTFGLAKFNLVDLDRRDTVSAPSRISEVATFSTEGRINVSVSTDLNWHQGKYMVMGYINYKKQPEYMLGIGNDVSIDDVEEVSTTRLKFVNYFLYQVVKNLYLGIGADLTNYSNIEYDSASFLVEDDVLGTDGGTGVGLGFTAAYDSRDNRYNAYKGWFISFKTMTFPAFLGNPYLYSSYDFDVRKYFNPWLKHVIALQATTSYRSGDVPFYELSMLGGEDKMRGYYKGALRDHVLVDCQLEYRLPIWNIFGMTAFVGTGRVAESYSDLSPDGFWLSYGLGVRIRVDTEHNTNLRFDWGFGPNGVNGFYINFAEAF